MSHPCRRRIPDAPAIDPPETALDERDLIERARDGHPAAQRALYDENVGRVMRVVERMTGDRAMAEDVVQDTFVRAFGSLERFEGRARFSTWLHSIAMSTCLNALRKRGRTRDHEQPVESFEAFDPGRDDPDGALRLALHRAIDTLGEDMRATFVMHDLEGYTHPEIAEALGVEVGTSKARLSRARAKLRDVLIDGDTLGARSAGGGRQR